jgi:hypothetical protein
MPRTADELIFHRSGIRRDTLVDLACVFALAKLA